MDIRNATALVTGANRGIGAALVRALLQAGAKKVYAAARDPARIDGIFADAGDRVVKLPLDVTNAAQAAALAELAPDVNLLINNAGVLDFGDVISVPLDAIERNFATNVYGPIHVTRALAPVIERNGGGAVVNMLSVVSWASMPGIAAYNASKAAAWSFTQALRATLAPKNIAVHAVFPGPVDTDMAEKITFPKTSPDEVARAILAGIEGGDEDITPDPMSAQVYAGWKQDPKAVEKQFGGY